MKVSSALLPLFGLALATSSLVACVYASDAPTPLSSGTGTAADGTDPANTDSDGGGGTNSGGGGGGGGGDTDAGGGGGGGGGTDAGKQFTDAGMQSTDAGQVSGPPTWTTIYATYFAAGTPGNCGASGCHLATNKGVKCADKATCFSTLTTQGYISGTSSPLATTQSCLTWYGSNGNMPPSGGANTKAKTAINAWVAAGASNN